MTLMGSGRHPGPGRAKAVDSRGPWSGTVTVALQPPAAGAPGTTLTGTQASPSTAEDTGTKGSFQLAKGQPVWAA